METKELKKDLVVITMDGPAGAGKSSLAKMLSEKLDLKQIDSGAIYRAYTYLSLQLKKEWEVKNAQSYAHVGLLLEEEPFIMELKNRTLQIDFSLNKQIIQFKNKILEEEIRTVETTANIKYLAEKSEIRNLVNDAIRKISKKFGIIADGRDMGTAVFPAADLKFFITASLEIRAKRRLKEFQEKIPNITLEEVKNQIAKRDFEDENRAIGPLKMANDAILVDTTFLSLESALEVLLRHIPIQLTKPNV